MVTDGQVKRLRRFLLGGRSLSSAAEMSEMDEKTARKWRDSERLPSEVVVHHDWRTRGDPFTEVWPEVSEQLSLNAGLQAKTLFAWLQRRYPGRFTDGQLRTLQRRVKVWRATEGPPKEVFFAQVHPPGRLGASDFTFANSLEVTIQGQRFDHLLYHFVLTYSNWETTSICFSESFESLSEGLQRALWELGGIPLRHRTDRLSAATSNLSEREEFTQRYEGLLRHYGLEGERTQAGHGNENGDVEQLHRRFKDAVSQALMLRGSRDFESRIAYERFLRDLLAQLNAGRMSRLAEEQKVLRPLPPTKLSSVKHLTARVDTGSLIHVGGNAYSVNSRLIGEKVDVWIHAEELEVWYAQKLVERLPRLRGRGKHRIQYRHVIDWLVRKPGAFERYRYREDLFPTSRFRMAYDELTGRMPTHSSKEYLRILELAARVNESSVDAALHHLFKQDRAISFETVEALVCQESKPTSAMDVEVAEADLSAFDELLTDKEVEYDSRIADEGTIDHASEGPAPADVS